jgi:hypothetical protein
MTFRKESRILDTGLEAVAGKGGTVAGDSLQSSLDFLTLH